MKIVLAILLAFGSSNLMAVEDGKPGSSYWLLSSNQDLSLAKKRSIYEFDFAGVEANKFTVRYSIDGQNKTFAADSGKRLIVNTTPGEHVFQFFVSGYGEVETELLTIQPQHRDAYKVYFVVPQIYKVTLKPVIYLYPEKETEMTVEMDIKGTDAFLYPAYIDSWKFKAQPNGDLIFGEETYNYLFWEANSSHPHTLSKNESGFIVSRDEVVPFLEDKLTLANLSSTEKADFITFWGPQLAQNDLNFVHFIFNEECDDYAGLEINPAPSNLYRIYIVWSKVEERFDVEKQVIKSANRDGFHIIEWGGQEQVLPKNIALINH